MLVVCGVLIRIVSAQGQETIDHAMIAKIRAEGTERSRVVEVFHTLTNVIGPRLTGSPAHKTAADWTRKRLEEWGASNARLEAFEFGRGWSLKKLTLELIAPRYFPLIGFPEAWSPSTKGELSGTPMYLGDKSAAEVEALGEKLRGAIVLALPPQTGFIQSDRKQPSVADEHVPTGAPAFIRNEGKTPLRDLLPLLQRFSAGVVLRPNQGEHGTIFVTGRRDTPNDAVPSIVLSSEQYNMIARLVQNGLPVRLRVDLRARYHEQDTNSYNVLAELPGNDPVLRNEVVMLGAHLDSWHAATGGTDNADAVAAMLEAVRILVAVDAHPKRTIRIALWSGEEQGLLGSRAYVQSHLAGPANEASRTSISVYLNDDPGSGPTYGFYMEENMEAKAIFDKWLEPLKAVGMKRNVIDKIGATDHLSFTALGIPAFTTIKDYRDYDVRTHHTNADYFERVSENDLKQSAVVMAVFAWQAAQRTGTFPSSTSK